MKKKTGILESRNLFRSLFALTLALLIGCATGFILRGLIPGKSSDGIVEIRTGGWKYVSPLLECEQFTPEKNNELKPFRQSVENFVTNDLKKKWGDDVSVYFRELNNGLHFEIGKEKYFYPASLLKVPMLITILKQAETNSNLLTAKVVFDNPKLLTDQNPEVMDRLIPGRSYTVDDLLFRMIKYSDNVSYDLLLIKVVNRAKFEETYNDLGIPLPYISTPKDNTAYMISAEQYASCFRVLYNASYLSKTMSEKALEYLSESEFTFGLVAGLPANVVVAHKFGIWTENNTRLLHDCGIVYYPMHPYLICVMTSAPAQVMDDHTIGELSRFIYQEIGRQHGIL